MGRSFGLNRAELFLAYDRDLVHRAKELRKHPTAAERKLWDEYLRTFPHRVLRQRPIDHFIVDFYCAALLLVIEVDGGIHDSEQSQVYDEGRSNILRSYGLTVLRVTNVEVIGDFDRVCEKIGSFLETRSP
jgi:very-short-patch-repair endonuclease